MPFARLLDSCILTNDNKRIAALFRDFSNKPQGRAADRRVFRG